MLFSIDVFGGRFEIEWANTFVYVDLSSLGSVYLDRTVSMGPFLKNEYDGNGNGSLWLCRRPVHYTINSRHTPMTDEEYAAKKEQFWKEVLEDEQAQVHLPAPIERQPS